MEQRNQLLGLIFLAFFAIGCAEGEVGGPDTTISGAPYTICVINSGTRNGTCTEDIDLDFGSLKGGNDVTRFVKVTPLRPIAIDSITLDVASTELEFTIMRLGADRNLTESQSKIFNPGSIAYIRYVLSSDASIQAFATTETLIALDADGEKVVETISINVDLEGCAEGFEDCDGDPENGCEVNTRSDVFRCGSCTNKCESANAIPVCNSGVCGFTECVDGFGNCDGEETNGCETNTDTNASECGTCGNACAPDDGSMVCLAGACELNMCATGTADCDANVAGCETDTTTDALNCGACGQPCALQNADSTCENSVCAVQSCTAPFNDCNLDPMDGCESDPADDPMNCGGCGTVCDFFGTVPTCMASQCSATMCLPDHYNLNQDLNDGCEYQCVFQAAFDLPDDTFADDNCDGIDGTVAEAIFVSVTGNDLNNGSKQTPLRTIQKGIDEAFLHGKDVYIATGIYTESSPVELKSGVSIYGGYNRITWDRTDTSSRIIISGPIAMIADGLNSETTLDRLEVRSGSASGASASAYALFVINSDQLTISNCLFQAGDGADGFGGNTPSGAGRNGPVGGRGNPGCEDSGGLCASCGRPSGGIGASNNSCPTGTRGGTGGRPGRNTTHGSPGTAGGSGAAGGPGAPDDRGNWNTDVIHAGKNGTNASTGSNGARKDGQYLFQGYVPGIGASGISGANGGGAGGGGGGGGGGSSCDSYGGSGGGGGAGGCGGQGATGGHGGGGSFAVYLYGSDVAIRDSTMITGRGGNGGLGGSGQAGGLGGAGGKSTSASRPNAGNNYGGSNEQDDGSNGGRGGTGGRGGRGGHGAGGDGGPSFGILGTLSSPTLLNNSYTLGAPGLRGTSSGNNGATGIAKNTELR